MSEKEALNKRIENISWGLFLVMLGGLWLVPGRLIPEGSWLIGAGLIMIGMNIVRFVNKIRMSGFSLVLGVIALLSGIGDLLRYDLPVFPILLILIGANILLRPFLERGSEISKEYDHE
ncbi:MAG: hypothetical protein ACYDH1_15030 [Anaerolineaceae bacterium]